MLIKNEINFDGINSQHNYGILVMIILYILSLFGCVLIVIILLKLIITCFFNEKFYQLFNQFSIRSNDQQISSDFDRRRRRVSDISVLSNNIEKDSKFSKIENIFVKISNTQISSKQQCICPVCANDHLSMTSKKNSSVMDSITTNLKKGQIKRSSFILRSAQVLSKKLVLKKENKTQPESDCNEDNNNEKDIKKDIIIPIVSQMTTEKIILKKMDRPLGDIKQIANYSDVVLELKEKFSSMTMINTIA